MTVQHSTLAFDGGATVTGLPTPVADSDAATKAYVDAAVAAAGGGPQLRPPDYHVRSGAYGSFSAVVHGRTDQALGEDSGVGAWTLSTGQRRQSVPRTTFTSWGLAANERIGWAWAFGTASATPLIHRGTQARAGGFRLDMSICPLTSLGTPNTNPMRGFYGLSADRLLADEDPFADLPNCVGLAWSATSHTDAGSETLHIIHNDGSGAPTAIDLGADFAVVNQLIRLELECPPHDGTSAQPVSYRVRNEDTNEVLSGSLTTNLPVDSTLLQIVQIVVKEGTDTGNFTTELERLDAWNGSPYLPVME